MAEATQSDIDSKDDDIEQSDDINVSEEPGLAGMILRDGAVVFGALSLWAAADTWHQTTGLFIAEVVAIVDALLVGAILATLFHEWGHYAGAKASGAAVRRVAPKGLSIFRFNFQFEENDHRQFHWMTYGGHIGHWAVVIILALALPLDTLSRISLVGAAFAFVVFATVIEYNIVKDTWNGADPATRLGKLTPSDFQQAGVIGAIAGLFAIAVLA